MAQAAFLDKEIIAVYSENHTFTEERFFSLG
jgi:hypothetical protein